MKNLKTNVKHLYFIKIALFQYYLEHSLKFNITFVTRNFYH